MLFENADPRLIKWDEKGLVPAIVQDYYTGRVLMLAYVNHESLTFMQENGETCFWSRSRNELWHKGATSGNVQKIKNISLDCDNDTLLITAVQKGNACHTGDYTCFGEEYGLFDILNKIFHVIEDRAANPKKDSYTNYLIDHGIDKICKKVGEESSETIIAAKNGTQPEIVAEIADLAYHLLVLMHECGISQKNIAEELQQRLY